METDLTPFFTFLEANPCPGFQTFYQALARRILWVKQPGSHITGPHSPSKWQRGIQRLGNRRKEHTRLTSFCIFKVRMSLVKVAEPPFTFRWPPLQSLSLLQATRTHVPHWAIRSHHPIWILHPTEAEMAADLWATSSKHVFVPIMYDLFSL